MVSQSDPIKTLVTRKNEVLIARENQLEINLLGYHGGQPYIDARLSRFAAESDIDWNGGNRKDGSYVNGRKEMSYVVPYLDRIVTKIDQYVFGIIPNRTNLDTEIEQDITSNGESLNTLMAEVSSYLTVNGWCWLGVDAPAIPIDTQISQVDKSQNKIRPYAQVYSANQVVDWYISPDGTIQWLITETREYIAKNPLETPYYQLVRRLWEPGKVTKIIIDEDKNEHIVEEILLSYTDKVPFVLVGKPSKEPHMFDSLESINRTILDLCSANNANYYHTVYPQLVLPASVMDTVMSAYDVNAETATTMIKGFAYPILLNENDATPAYLMPDASSIGSMRSELDSLKNELYESVGLLLKKESKQVESAEAKRWDTLDLDMLIRARAEKLEEAEQKIAKIFNGWDSEIPEWDVVYNKSITELVPNSVEEDVKKAIEIE